MPATAGVGAQAQQVRGVFSPTVSIQNVGPGDVYLGTDGSVTPTNGWLLPARAMGTWNGGDQLWACTAGGTSELRIADSALTYFTPGPDVVEVSGGTVTVDNASIPITGTVDIASGTVEAVISGPVTINGGTVQVGGSVTALNGSLPLANTMVAVNAPTGGGAVWNSGVTDLTPYSSLVLQFGNFAGMAGVDPSRGVAISIQQYSSNGGILLKEDRPRFFASGVMRYTTDIVGSYIVITAYGLGAAQFFTGFSAVASVGRIPHSYWQTGGNTSQTVGFSSSGVNDNSTAKEVTLTAAQVAGASTSYWYPSSWSGEAHFLWYISAVGTASSSFILSDGISGDNIRWSSPANLTSAARADSGLVYLPESPVSVIVLQRESSPPAGRTIGAALVYS